MNEKIVKVLKEESELLLGSIKRAREAEDFIKYKNLIKALTEVLELIKEYNWELKFSKYETDGKNFVCSWEQNNKGDVRVSEHYEIKELPENVKRLLDKYDINYKKDEYIIGTFEIIENLACKWDNMMTYDKEVIAEGIAGKRQADVLIETIEKVINKPVENKEDKMHAKGNVSEFTFYNSKNVIYKIDSVKNESITYKAEDGKESAIICIDFACGDVNALNKIKNEIWRIERKCKLRDVDSGEDIYRIDEYNFPKVKRIKTTHNGENVEVVNIIANVDGKYNIHCDISKEKQEKCIELQKHYIDIINNSDVFEDCYKVWNGDSLDYLMSEKDKRKNSFSYDITDEYADILNNEVDIENKIKEIKETNENKSIFIKGLHITDYKYGHRNDVKYTLCLEYKVF